ncbi:MAG: hypothetical protein ISS25_00115 [Nanoarchaeota archaeon]|nr:hypothetical protein [DPANN group archaeon]MBL7116223.1 hypothetical protein [Nanoarchaeota archaeon]
MIKNLKEKMVGATGSVSGVTSILGSWQVCHNLCLGIIAILGIIGITIVGMPLLFLTKVAVPFWIVAFILLLVTIGFYVKKKCISNRLIMFNSGLIIAGIPFQPLQSFSKFFWLIGGALAITGVSLYINDKIQNKMKK